MSRLALFVLVACTPMPAKLPIDQVQALELPAPEEHGIDCRLSKVIRARFPHDAMRPCGTLEVGASDERIAAARRCVAASIEDHAPFLVEQRIADPQDVVAHAVFASGPPGYDVFHAYYVMPPCRHPGDDCPVVPNTRITYCPHVAMQPCAGDVMACVRCDSEEPLESCSTYYKRDYD